MIENIEDQLISNSMDILSKLRDDEMLVSVFFIDQINFYRDKKLASYFINKILSENQKFGRIKIAGIVDAIYEYQLSSSISEEVVESLIRLVENYFYDNDSSDTSWINKVLDIVLNSYSPRKLEMLIDILSLRFKPYPEKHFGIFSEKLLKTILIEKELNVNFKYQAKIYKLKIEDASKEEEEKNIKHHISRIIKELSMIPSKKIIDVFISYSHEGDEHKTKVIEFTNHLRKLGFNAKCDFFLKQQETSIDFDEMMLDQISRSDKIILVLTEEYKRRADDTKQSGIKDEMKLIKQILEKSDNKIILVSFKSLPQQIKPDQITPLWLASREVIDLKDDMNHGLRTLISKLKEIELLNFVEVNSEQSEIESEKIGNFTLDDI